MLRELHISNLAIIEDVQVELDAALTVFTGATGAGKSLVIGALQLLLGMRPASKMVRGGKDEGRVSGVFVVSDPQLRAEIGALADVAIDDEEILITRRLLASGRGSCSVNGQPVTVAMLQRIGELLVDIHGQHDHQFLLRPANQLSVLDDFAGCGDLREQTADAYHQWQECLGERKALAGGAELRRQQLALYEFQAAEIDGADVRPGEIDELDARHRRLANIDRIRQVTSSAHAALDEDDGLLDRLRVLVRDLRDLARLDAQLAKIVEPTESAALALDEAANDLRQYVESLDFDPAELAEVEARLALLRQLCGKYGGSIEEVLAYREKIEADTVDLRRRQDDFSRIDERIAESEQQYNALAKTIGAKRRTAAKTLAAAVNKQLGQLGMDKAVFDVQLEQTEAGPTGRDQAEMMVRTNPGQPLAPLRQIASGGELSRVMLAIKSMLADVERSSVLVFDEVDAHVGGRLGSVIGDKLRALATKHQVVCITHLPQIAAYATRHLKVTKIATSGQARTEVQVIKGQDRVEELAEMIAGPNKTPTSRRQARELLQRAENP